MKQLLFFLLCPLLVCGQMTAEKTFINKVPTVVYKPSGFDPAKRYPTVLFLHGKGEMGNGSETELTAKILNNGNHAELLKRAEINQWVVIAPQLVQSLNDWIPGWTNKYLQPVYDFILQHPNTDPSQIFVTGLSLGGGGTWVACTGPFAQHIAAAVPICGTPEYNQDFSLIAKHSIPVWAFHATDDGTVNYVATLNQVANIKKYNPDPAPLMTLYPNGNHWIWGRVYSDDAVYSWLSKQRKGATPAPPTPSIVARLFVAGFEVIVYSNKTAEVR